METSEVREIRKAAWLAELIKIAEDYAREGVPLDDALQAIRDGYSKPN